MASDITYAVRQQGGDAFNDATILGIYLLFEMQVGADEFNYL